MTAFIIFFFAENVYLMGYSLFFYFIFFFTDKAMLGYRNIVFETWKLTSGSPLNMMYLYTCCAHTMHVKNIYYNKHKVNREQGHRYVDKYKIDYHMNTWHYFNDYKEAQRSHSLGLSHDISGESIMVHIAHLIKYLLYSLFEIWFYKCLD